MARKSQVWIVVSAVALSCSLFPVSLLSQDDVAARTDTAALAKISSQLNKRAKAAKQRAEGMARRTGLPVRRELPNHGVMEIQRISPNGRPVYYITHNIDAADSVSTDELWPGGSTGLNIDGAGMTVGEWDGGAVFASHPDLFGRVTQVDGATSLSNHATHVAGTLIGAGAWLDPTAKGMAPSAHLDAHDWTNDTSEMATAAAGGMLISNHSYGIATGWLYLGDAEPDTWWWIGGSNPGDVEDMNFGYYDTESQTWDQIARDAPYYLIVKAAGNDRWETGPDLCNGGNRTCIDYTVVNQDGDALFFSDLPRTADCTPGGYDCLPTHSTAKNILTVGAVDDLAGGYSPATGPSSVTMAAFSGWGPTDDGRVKPDVVGNGMWLQSTWGALPFYAASLGTSMASPNVTGSLLLLQQHYENLHGSGNYMRASALRVAARM